ncbi:MAG: hypothetical protein BAJATHORv1_90027 [Candidatus Thorarchaeota archaeon]|nr:MAG: hypothetical protein BAJATHORv1_90027 [Candidatus Thorarchaeota archaeon]
MIGVVNSSPLIYLGKLGLVNLLNELFDGVFTTRSVMNEVLDDTSPEFAILTDAFASWLNLSDVIISPLSTKLCEMGLHQGEVDVITLAFDMREKGPVVIIDDLAARDIGRTLGLYITGTIGIILRAVKNNMLSKTDAVVKLNYLVQETPFRISTKLYLQILEQLR